MLVILNQSLIHHVYFTILWSPLIFQSVSYVLTFLYFSSLVFNVYIINIKMNLDFRDHYLLFKLYKIIFNVTFILFIMFHILFY